MFSLVRNIGSSIGIAIVQDLLVRTTQVVHASLAARLTPFAVATHPPEPFRGQAAIAALNRLVTTQAAMIAYVDVFYLMLVLVCLSLPLLLLVRGAGKRPSEPPHIVNE